MIDPWSRILLTCGIRSSVRSNTVERVTVVIGLGGHTVLYDVYMRDSRGRAARSVYFGQHNAVRQKPEYLTLLPLHQYQLMVLIISRDEGPDRIGLVRTAQS